MYVFFLCLFLMRSFVVQIFPFFRTRFGLLNHLDVYIVVQFISSTGIAVVVEGDLLYDSFLFEKIIVTNWQFSLACGLGYLMFLQF